MDNMEPKTAEREIESLKRFVKNQHKLAGIRAFRDWHDGSVEQGVWLGYRDAMIQVGYKLGLTLESNYDLRQRMMPNEEETNA